MDELIISVFCDADNFYKKFELYIKEHCLSCNEKLSIKMCSRLTEAEVITICAVFHLSGYRTFIHYYSELISDRYKKFFPDLVSYNRFVELMPYVALPLAFFVCTRSGKCSGISFIDSTTLNVCDNHRINQHKVKGCISQKLFDSLWDKGIELIIKQKKNVKKRTYKAF